MDDMARKAAEEAGAKIARLFLGRRPKRARAKPSRCLGCGRVTRHVFCPDTADECRRLYHERPQ
jgi:hypothetical protein